VGRGGVGRHDRRRLGLGGQRRTEAAQAMLKAIPAEKPAEDKKG
jgi:hypothetical protein